MSNQCHVFSVEYAKLYGIECATLINHFQFWINQNIRTKKNFHDGKTWMYQTQKEIAAVYEYWNRDVVQKLLKKLVDFGVLIRGNYNKSKFDNTTWYAFSNEKMFLGVQNPTMSNQSHSFSVEYAKLYGIECATLINHFQFWINQNSKTNKNFHDGKTWMYQTQKEIAAVYNYWNRDVVQRLLKKLVDFGVLIRGNYNKSKFDNTAWFAFENEKMFIDVQFRTTTCLEKKTPLCETAQYIPNTNTNTNTYTVNDRASQSVTSNLNLEKAKKDKKFRLNESQLVTLKFLQSLDLDTGDPTLRWWSKNYSIERLKLVYAEAVKRKPRSIGAYINKLLKKDAVVTVGRVEENRKFSEEYKKSNNWRALEIKQKYALIHVDNTTIEIDFNMPTSDFIIYLMSKHDVF